MSRSMSFQSSKSRAERTAILHLCSDLEPDSPGREVAALAILTQRSGWRAYVGSSGGHLVHEVERAAVLHQSLPIASRSLINTWRTNLTLQAFIQKERPTLLHAHGIHALPFALSCRHHHNLPIIAEFTHPFAETPQTKKLITNLLSGPSSIHISSEFMSQHLYKSFGVNFEQMQLIQPGVDLNWYSAGFISPERLHNLSQLWRLPEQASIVLMSMPLTQGLGHAVILEALANLKEDNVFVVLAGCGRQSPALRQDIEDLIHKLNLDGKVIMPEFCYDLPAACWLSSVVVAVNTEPRGLNFELLAAQAIGRPIIVSNVGANSEMVLKGETSWIVPPSDVSSFTNALRDAIHLDTAQRLSLAETAHNFIAENFPQDTWLEKVLGSYQTLLHPRPPTTSRAVA